MGPVGPVARPSMGPGPPGPPAPAPQADPAGAAPAPPRMRLVEVEDAMGPLGWVPVPDPEPPAADPALDLAIAAEQARLKGSLGALETVAKLIQDLPVPRGAEAERTKRAESFETKVSEQREQLQELHSIQVL